MTETIIKVAFNTEAIQGQPEPLSVGIADLAATIGVIFHLHIDAKLASELEQIYHTNPAPKVELTVSFKSYAWTATGQVLGALAKPNDGGAITFDFTFQPDAPLTIKPLMMYLSQSK